MHAQPPSEPPAAHVTPYDRLTWPAETVERLLASGGQARELAAYFGETAYAEFSELARRLDPLPAQSADRVYILPGIMGSQLGLARARPLPDDVIWVDPLDLAIGRLTALRAAPGSRVIPLGVLLYNYMKLRLVLRSAGYDVVFHDYDWRLSIGELGAAFAARVARDVCDARARTGRITVVAHSMGGLVARAALRHAGGADIDRVIMLGTPSGGSFAPVQALRGTSPVVRRIASLDHRHSAEQLAEQVFSSFTSLYDMLPRTGSPGVADLRDPANWPASGPGPRPRELAAAAALENLLAPADERLRMIAGSGTETVTGAELRDGEFLYRSTREGDGTVPLALALAGLAGVPTRYTSVAHGDLPQHAAVIAAVLDLVAQGTTCGLDAAPAPPAPLVRELSDSQLRRSFTAKVDWASLTPQERRRFLDRLNEPPEMPAEAGRSP